MKTLTTARRFALAMSQRRIAYINRREPVPSSAVAEQTMKEADLKRARKAAKRLREWNGNC